VVVSTAEMTESVSSGQLSRNEKFLEAERSDSPCTSNGEMQKLESITSSRLWLEKSELPTKLRIRQSHGKWLLMTSLSSTPTS